MKENFLPYESAKQLKELAFDERCMAEYENKRMRVLCLGNKNSHYKPNTIVCTPLWQQAKQWLWNEHCITFIQIHRAGNYAYEIWDADEPELLGETKYFKSPIEAENEGIISAINYLFNQIKK